MITVSNNSLGCRTEKRRHKTREAGWNGIDYLEVSEDQIELKLFFLGRAPEQLVPANVRITGGRRIRDIEVRDLRVDRSTAPRFDDCLVVTVNRPGDFSTYRICLVDLDERGRSTDEPMSGFDPRYACLDFGFKAGCPSGLDCKQPEICPPPEHVAPDIDYLARDYITQRKVILDRLSLLVPDWCDRHVPDVGITLVELLAYAGDRLSYMQDSVATEAYLDTARQRVSVSRHARLVDYRLHEGCNARAWVCMWADTSVTLQLDTICLLAADLPVSTAVMSQSAFAELPATSREVFEPVLWRGRDFTINPAHNRIRFYTWSDEECCLATGATSATLLDEWLPPPQIEIEPSNDPVEDQPDDSSDDAPCDDDAPTDQPRNRMLDLTSGDILIFEEVIGPRTGNSADADPAHRHAVCLTAVEHGIDPVCEQPIVEVHWSSADALPFPLCLSSQGPPPDCDLVEDVSVACGNVILVDHGLTHDEGLGKVPLQKTEQSCGDPCHPPAVILTPGEFRPRLEHPDVTWCETLPSACPARDAVHQDPRRAVPHAHLTDWDRSSGETASWHPVLDLLDSRRDDLHFVVEVENDGRSRLRFGDGEIGARPAACIEMTATYRTGNGPAGNVGAEAINRIVSKESLESGLSIRARNPLPAVGGRTAESMDEARLFAPHAFRRVLARAVTAEDYATIVERDFGEVQRASAALRFTGSHIDVLVAIDELGRLEASAELVARIAAHLNRYRRINHDVRVVAAVHVALELEITICVRPEYLRGDVEAAARATLSRRLLPDGSKGLFHPDNQSFGTGVIVSQIVAAVHALDGVESVVVRRLERLFEGPLGEIEAGVLTLESFEIARLDNDPSMPENGILTLNMRGGR